MIPKLTDDAVSRLPLESGRAELLEEIMSTVAPERTQPEPTRTPTRRQWVAPVAAAAAVVLLAGGTTWWATTSPGPDGSGQVAAGASGYRAVLEAPGWVATSSEEDGSFGEVDYAKGTATFDITWYPAKYYDSYVQDRRAITDPASDGSPLTVLGAAAQLWAYSDTDHTVIRSVADGHWLEFRGTGIGTADYLALLDQLRTVDHAGLEAALPASFVDTADRPAAIRAVLDGIRTYVDPVFPPGASTRITSEQSDPYQLGAEVAGAVACSWLDEYAAAKAADDQPRELSAVEALSTARQWPVLQQMDASGDFPEQVWDYADQVAAGQVPTDYRQSVVCQS